MANHPGITMRRIAIALFVSMLAGSLLSVPLRASADVSVGVSVAVSPPPLPYYPQPFCPGPGYIWTPGYWAYDSDEYYWVPGTWVFAPRVGFLWTPGYWGWNAGFYVWHPGYWGPHVGFYGGIVYGFGYTGIGYAGGYWRGNDFYYNRSITNVNVNYVHNTYNQAVVADANVSRVSYNGGTGGIAARPTPQEESYAREQHVAATANQMKHEQTAMNSPGQRFSANKGKPAVAATVKPGKLNAPDAVRRNEAMDRYEYKPVMHRQAGPRDYAPRQPQPHPRNEGKRHPPRR